MPSQITHQQYGQAVLEHVQTGVYPESEAIISADLPSSVLPDISRLIEHAQEEVKINVKKTSKNSAPDIDGWISQAKQLQVDILRSQEIAREVVDQAQNGKKLQERVDDASSKVDLLHGEIFFNESLGATLERIQIIQRKLGLVQRATLDSRLEEAVDLITQAHEDLASLSAIRSTKILNILEAKTTDLRNLVREKLTDSWNQQVCVNAAMKSVQVNPKADGPYMVGLDALVTAMTKLDMYRDVLELFCVHFESLIVLPRLKVRSDGTIRPPDIADNRIGISAASSDLSAQALFQDLDAINNFLRSQLPRSIYDPLADSLMPRLVSKLISAWLSSAVPENLDGMEDFEDTLSLVSKFGETLAKYKWPGKRDLDRWTEGIPDVWLRKRQEITLHHVRKLLSNGLSGIQSVERVETQVISRNNEVFANNGGGEDWNAGWSDDETSITEPKNPTKPNEVTPVEDEEDVSAWDLDDEQDNTAAQGRLKSSTVADDDADAWGWGDEAVESTKASPPLEASPIKPRSKGMPAAAHEAEREVTLRETYNITSLPKDIIEIIGQVVSDVTRLETPEYASLPIASAASDLLILPGLILAMYRAGSSISYSQHPSGQMFLYNDSLWLAERLNQLYADNTNPSGRRITSRIAFGLKLPGHVSALESFAKRAYAKEMESQRTIITDLLDGAQGFSNCTESLIAGVIDLAIVSTTDRVRQLHKEWKDILSQSALLQSLGSLLSTVINKIILDIEDLTDISEPQSQQLTTYCNRITTLEDIFRPVQHSSQHVEGEEQEAMPLTPFYTSHWLKFQYLSSILESSLVDIKYLWTEGELGLEFDTEELVDLVVALFEDSPHRRTAVAEIRGRRTVR